MRRDGAAIRILLGALLRAGVADAAPPPRPPVPEPPLAWAGFEDATVRAGLRFRHDSSPPLLYPPQIMGPGVAFGDFDADGWVDLYVPDSAPPPTRPRAGDGPGGVLWRNRGDGTFQDVTAGSGIRRSGQGMGAAWGDLDNDGALDLFVTGFGGCQLFRNLGDGTFLDVTLVTGSALPGRFSAHAAWADHDRDGWLDLYVTGYLDFRYPEADMVPRITSWRGREVPEPMAPPLHDGTPNALFRNEHGARLTDITTAAGVGDDDDRLGKGLGALWTDVDRDGWPDLVVANDGVRKSVYRNRGDGTFESAGSRMWLADPYGSMGVCGGDVDHDGFLDIHFSNWFEEPNTLYLNRRGTMFVDASEPAGLATPTGPRVGWGCEFLDADNDGNLDLVVACGSTFPPRYRWAHYLEDDHLMEPQPMFYFRGDGRGGFVDLSAGAGLAAVDVVGRGLALADVDRDGWLDVVIGVNNGPPVFLRNRGGTGPPAGWLAVIPVGTRSNRSAVGARLILEADGKTQTREIQAGSSYLSASASEAHFGLGPGPGRITRLEVHWPAGGRTVLGDLAPNRCLVVREPAPEAAAGPGAR